MSAILAVCSTAFCAMVSDGRMVEEPAAQPPKIITEDLPKLRKVNGRVCVGFAGDALTAVRIVNALDEYQVQYLTLEKVVKILQERGRALQALPLGVRLLVGGRNRRGEFQLTSLGSAQNYEAETQQAREGAYLIEGACSHTEVAPFLAQYVQGAVPGWKTVDDIGLSMEACLKAIAAQDAAVNTKCYRQLIV